MWTPFALLSIPWVPATVATGYIGAGVWFAQERWRHTHRLEHALGALVAWPFLLSSETAKPAPPTDAGDLRIQACFAPLIRDLAATPEPEALQAELGRLRAGLQRAVDRIQHADRILADASPHQNLGGTVQASVERLQAARDHASREIDAVLAGVVDLRVRMGLVALRGDTGPVRELLGELGARVSALEELEAVPPR